MYHCTEDRGVLTFTGDCIYTLRPEVPDTPEKVVGECMIARTILSGKAPSGNSWAGSVANQLQHKIQQLEIRLMDLAIDNIKLKESR